MSPTERLTAIMLLIVPQEAMADPETNLIFQAHSCVYRPSHGAASLLYGAIANHRAGVFAMWFSVVAATGCFSHGKKRQAKSKMGR